VESTLPWSWYFDPEILRLEQDAIFRRTWQYVGHLGQVAEPGSFFAGRAGDVPVVVTRAQDGELRAFLNVCRHRGTVIVEGQGSRASLQCPYHAWTYGLDGALRAAPRSDETAPRDELGLIPLRVAEWGPFVFVNPEASGPSLEETLGELWSALPMDGLAFHHRVEYALESNWKVACENYLECYHCAVAHPGFSAVIDVSPDEYLLQRHRWHMSQYAHVKNGARYSPGEPPGSPEIPSLGPLSRTGDSVAGQFHFVWPNLKVNVYPGRPNLSIGPVWPDGSERSRGFLDYFFAPDEDESWIRDLLELDDQVGREDTALVERVQRGVRSGVLTEGRLLGESEQLIAHFDGLVREALAQRAS
jgi:phenylpropionate dioxygenase-like ring-hydroxylating dioxygenase large terminal subunit